jgi:hypothetical protein
MGNYLPQLCTAGHNLALRPTEVVVDDVWRCCRLTGKSAIGETNARATGGIGDYFSPVERGIGFRFFQSDFPWHFMINARCIAISVICRQSFWDLARRALLN